MVRYGSNWNNLLPAGFSDKRCMLLSSWCKMSSPPSVPNSVESCLLMKCFGHPRDSLRSEYPESPVHGVANTIMYGFVRRTYAHKSLTCCGLVRSYPMTRSKLSPTLILWYRWINIFVVRPAPPHTSMTSMNWLSSLSHAQNALKSAMFSKSCGL